MELIIFLYIFKFLSLIINMRKNLEELEVKIITLGSKGVGKTSIINRIIQKDFNPDQISTIGLVDKLFKKRI